AMAVRSFGTAHSAVEADWSQVHVARDGYTHHDTPRTACHERLLTGCTYLRAAPRLVIEAARICSQGLGWVCHGTVSNTTTAAIASTVNTYGVRGREGR